MYPFTSFMTSFGATILILVLMLSFASISGQIGWKMIITVIVITIQWYPETCATELQEDINNLQAMFHTDLDLIQNNFRIIYEANPQPISTVNNQCTREEGASNAIRGSAWDGRVR
jgi:hypothetical protein